MRKKLQVIYHRTHKAVATMIAIPMAFAPGIFLLSLVPATDHRAMIGGTFFIIFLAVLLFEIVLTPIVWLGRVIEKNIGYERWDSAKERQLQQLRGELMQSQFRLFEFSTHVEDMEYQLGYKGSHKESFNTRRLIDIENEVAQLNKEVLTLEKTKTSCWPD